MTSPAAAAPRAQILGRGVFSWRPDERRTDRYGTCGVMDSRGMAGQFLPLRWTTLTGQRGVLVAVVTGAPRRSGHVGDLFRQIFPTIPNPDERIVLGTGRLFFETIDGAACAVGVLPEDGRLRDWLNPQALYRAHDQDVALIFEVDALH